MTTKLIALIAALLVAAGGAGLYYGTDLFAPDPLRGAGDPVALEPLQASTAAGAAAIAAREFTSHEAAPSATTPAPIGSLGEAAVVMPRSGALSVAKAAAADIVAEMPAAADPDSAGVDAAKAMRPWKTSYAWDDETLAAGEAEAPPALPLAAASAERPAAERALAIGAARATTSGEGRAADAPDLAEAPARQAPPWRMWKVSYALDDDAAAAEGLDRPVAVPVVAAEPRHEPEARARAVGSRPAGIAGPQAIDVAGPGEADAAAPKALVRWKTSFALDEAAPVARRADPAAARLVTAMASPPLAKPAVIPRAPLIAIAAVEVEEPGVVRVIGRSDPWAIVRLYLNEDHLGEASAGEAGAWRLIGDGELPPGRHVVRADLVDDDGLVAASAEMRFDRVQVVMAEEPAPAEPPAADSPAVAAAPSIDEIAEVDFRATGPTMVHIERGDTLWHIARAVYGFGDRYTVIYEANRGTIRNPHLIFPGQVFTIPLPD